jgi:membrane protein implicated in regulation of membrane protease activity
MTVILAAGRHPAQSYWWDGIVIAVLAVLLALGLWRYSRFRRRRP